MGLRHSGGGAAATRASGLGDHAPGSLSLGRLGKGYGVSGGGIGLRITYTLKRKIGSLEHVHTERRGCCGLANVRTDDTTTHAPQSTKRNLVSRVQRKEETTSKGGFPFLDSISDDVAEHVVFRTGAPSLARSDLGDRYHQRQQALG